MARGDSIGITAEAFAKLTRTYRQSWRVDVCAVDVGGRVCFGTLPRRCIGSEVDRQIRTRAVAESLRWGEAFVAACGHRRLIWAVPLLQNSKVCGGVLASVPESHVTGATGGAGLDVRVAGADLRAAMEAANLTNAALLREHRRAYRLEQERAEAIHATKAFGASNVREMYLRDEPALLAAIRKGHLGEARGILNQILTAMLHQAGNRLDLLKSFFMELVVMMSRSAVEAGGEAEQLLGVNYVNIAQLSEVQSQQQLAPWLHEMLERIMGAIQHGGRRSADRIASEAMAYMKSRLDERLTRDEVAEAVGVSAWHFSRVFQEATGVAFGQALRKLRVDHACELLRQDHEELSAISLACGFADQSHFTKVFRRQIGQTPASYRRAWRRDGETS